MCKEQEPCKNIDRLVDDRSVTIKNKLLGILKKTKVPFQTFSLFFTSFWIYYGAYYTFPELFSWSSRMPHHFMAGFTFPHIIRSMYKGKEKFAPFAYVLVCIMWEFGQVLYYDRGLQVDQFSMDLLGVSFYRIIQNVGSHIKKIHKL